MGKQVLNYDIPPWMGQKFYGNRLRWNRIYHGVG